MFKWRLNLERPFPGIQHEEKRCKVFSSAIGEEARLLDGFLRDIDSHNHAINPNCFAKDQNFTHLPLL